ncbi:MAG: TatD family hydrolase [Lentisphaeria bacterium]|nr:TatD family hydrolase [Lentisphaeria bacterium]
MILINAHTHTAPDNEPGRLALVNLKPGTQLRAKAGSSLFSCGIHPADTPLFSLRELRETVTGTPCSAIGECGLDARAAVPLEQQEEGFLAQILLSEELRLPMVIHCVRKDYEIIRLRKETSAKMPWLIHGFRGKQQTGMALLNAGCLLSLSPVWLLHQTSFPSWLPADSFLLETDESPLPLSELYSFTAQLRGESMESLSELLQNNFCRFLRLEEISLAGNRPDRFN